MKPLYVSVLFMMPYSLAHPGCIHILTMRERMSAFPCQIIITFRVRHSRDETCSGHGPLCVCLSVPHCIPTLLHAPGYNFGEW